MKALDENPGLDTRARDRVWQAITKSQITINCARQSMRERFLVADSENRDRGDVPGWVLVVLMTTGLVTAIWTIAAPRLTAILRNSLDSMNGIR